MNYNLRIDENFLKGDHTDGEVLQHTDLNELENVVKTAINANYEDIQKLQDGTLPVSGAASVVAGDGTATVSQYAQETLGSSDNKIPSSLQVKSYVDNLYNNINDSLIMYWDGTSSQASVNLFNSLCDKYDNNEKFLLFGRFNVQFLVWQPVEGEEGVYEQVYTYREVVSPIIVHKTTDLEQPGGVMYSFVTPPIFYGGQYAIGSVSATGNWGEFTAVGPASWSKNSAPVALQELGEFAGTPLTLAFTNAITGYSAQNNTFAINSTDGSKLFNAAFVVSAGRVLTLSWTINGVPITFIGSITRSEFTGVNSDNYYCAAELVALGQGNTLKASIILHYQETNPDTHTWTQDNANTTVTFSGEVA